MEKLGFCVVVFLAVSLLIVVGPLLTLWSINTLFPALSIPYTFWTWLATFVLMIPFGNKGAVSVKGSK